MIYLNFQGFKGHRYFSPITNQIDYFIVIRYYLLEGFIKLIHTSV